MAEEKLELRTVLARLEQMEKEHRRLKVVSWLVILSVAVPLLMGQIGSKPTVLEAREIVLRDANGTRRVLLSALQDSPGLFLYDGNEKKRAHLMILDGEPQLYLFDADRKGRFGVRLVKGHEPQLNLWAADETPRVVLRAATILGVDMTQLLLNGDSQGANILHLEVLSDGPSATLSDERGYSSVFGVSDLLTLKTGRQEKTSAASIVMFGKDKKVLWSAP